MVIFGGVRRCWELPGKPCWSLLVIGVAWAVDYFGYHYSGFLGNAMIVRLGGCFQGFIEQ